MALISCPNCGQSISDKATKCVHCGVDFNDFSKVIKCPECGTEIGDDNNTCPVCGYPLKSYSVDESPQVIEMYGPQEDEIIYIQGETKPKKKKAFAIVSICILLVLCIALGGSAYYSLAKARKEYKKKYAETCLCMASGTSNAEKSFNLIYAVWYNTIYQIDDVETDYFTKDSNGRFNRDVTDSLLNMMNNQYFLALANDLESNRRKCDNLMIELKEYPRGFDDEYIKLRNIYDSYNEMIDVATCPSGDIDSYIIKYGEVHSKVVKGLEESVTTLEEMKKTY